MKINTYLICVYCCKKDVRYFVKFCKSIVSKFVKTIEKLVNL